VAGWGFLQAALVPGPTDAVLVPLGLSDPRRAYRLAAFAVLGSVLGGVVAYAVGSGALGNFAPWLLETLGMTPAAIEVSRGVFESRGWMLVLASTVSPLSAKMVSIAAGAFGLPFWQFLVAIVVGRTVRNVVLAAILRRAGPALQRRLSRSLHINVPGAAVVGTSPSGAQM
jgi:membrane protein YqaA with SNARE-associated domain